MPSSDAMKLMLLGFALACLGARAFGQGEFFFTNRDTTEGVNARFVLPTDPPGTSSVGTEFRVELFGGPTGTPVEQLLPLDPPSTGFRRPAGAVTAGYVYPQLVRVPGVPIFSVADVLVRVFDGPSWENASYRFEGVFSVKTEMEILRTLPMGSSPLVLTPVPEPNPAIFGFVNAGLLALLRLCRWRFEGGDHSNRRLLVDFAAVGFTKRRPFHRRDLCTAKIPHRCFGHGFQDRLERA